MKTLLSLSLALCFGLVALADDKKETKFDAAKLVGDWTYVEGMRSGDKVEKDHLAGVVTFEKDKVMVPAGPDAKFVMAFKIDDKATPATIDMEIKDGPVKEGKAIGIISVDGDNLKICYVVEGNKRPAKFESTKDNNAFFFTLKKAKAK